MLPMEKYQPAAAANSRTLAATGTAPLTLAGSGACASTACSRPMAPPRAVQLAPADRPERDRLATGPKSARRPAEGTGPPRSRAIKATQRSDNPLPSGYEPDQPRCRETETSVVKQGRVL